VKVAIWGSTGAGRGLDLGIHFTECNKSIKAYGVTMAASVVLEEIKQVDEGVGILEKAIQEIGNEQV
ncbi:MAG: hypothetical protein RR915_06280, partial [Cellulosilyticaceae bacterium]